MAESSETSLLTCGDYRDPDGQLPIAIVGIFAVGAVISAYDSYQAYKERGLKALGEKLAVEAAMAATGGGKLMMKAGKALKSVADSAEGVANKGGQKLLDVPKSPGNPNTASNPGTISVTKDGFAFAGAEHKIPDGYVQNPHGRSGSYGEIVNGKFKERLRIDPATPPCQKGPNYSHYHTNGKGRHHSPRRGDTDPGFQ